jgi:circadian clock protein KaiC
MRSPKSPLAGIAKCPTSIRGLDEITNGGLPRGRPTLVCGSAGSGKTLLAMEFIVRGARDFNEPGVFVAFEETTDELAANVASLGFDLPALVKRKKLAIDYVRIERSEIEETGEYNLEGLFVRLALAMDSVGAKRIALDSLEALFAGLPNEAILRAELRRLFNWLKQRGVTAVITAEQGRNALTRHGLEEYISDCVIFLDHRVVNQVATRRLRIVKYRGSAHGTNEYPMLIDEHGLSVLPISSVGMQYSVTRNRITSGIPRLDTMLGGKGYYQGSSILISGTAGAGKTSIAAAFADSICERGRRCLYWSSEESAAQLIRNMSSIGIDLGRHVRAGRLQIESLRPTLYGLENHLVNLHNLVTRLEPEAVVMDPVNNLHSIGDEEQIKSMLIRVLDFLKSKHVTAMFTTLTPGGAPIEHSGTAVSSLMDTWILLRMIESASERNRVLCILKSRGMAHSNQRREFTLSDHGINLVDVYVGSGAVYSGTERMNQEARDQAAALAAQQTAAHRARELEQERRALEAQMAVLHAKLATLAAQRDKEAAEEKVRIETLRTSRVTLARARSAD